MLELQQRLPHDLPLALLVEVDLLERPLADLARPLNLRETKLEEQNTIEKNGSYGEEWGCDIWEEWV